MRTELPRTGAGQTGRGQYEADHATACDGSASGCGDRSGQRDGEQDVADDADDGAEHQSVSVRLGTGIGREAGPGNHVHAQQPQRPHGRTEEPGDKPDTDETGFLPGLEDGWKALTTVGAGLATVAGAVLPFAVVLALLGLPVWRVVRRVLRRRPERPAASPAT